MISLCTKGLTNICLFRTIWVKNHCRNITVISSFLRLVTCLKQDIHLPERKKTEEINKAVNKTDLF